MGKLSDWFTNKFGDDGAWKNEEDLGSWSPLAFSIATDSSFSHEIRRVKAPFQHSVAQRVELIELGSGGSVRGKVTTLGYNK